MGVFVTGLAWSISTGLAGFWKGLPFWVIVIFCLSLLIYDSLKSIKKIILACKKNNVSIMEGFSYRFHPQQKEVERILNQKRIGEIRNFSSCFLLPILPSANNFRFNKKISHITLSKKGIEVIGKKAITLAEYEGLIGHAQSIKSRIRRK